MKLFFQKIKQRNAKTVAVLICAVLICALIIAGGIFMFEKLFTHTPGTKPVTSPITSFESLTLRLSGMRLTEEYELTCKGNETEVSLYWFNYSTGEETKQLQASATVNTQDVLTLFNACDIAKWNGFDGPHPKYVSDGTMFDLTATVGGGETIHAQGSQNFPKHFHEFEDGLKSFLND